MNLEQMRERLQAIVAKLAEFDGVENFSEENVTEINNLNEEFASLKSNIEAKEKINAMKATSQVSTRKVTPSVSNKIEVKATRLEKNMGFKNIGELAQAVHQKGLGNVDKRFQNSYAYEKFAEDGGVLIPEDFMPGIDEKIVKGDESLLPRTDFTPISGNHLSLNIDEDQPWNGGVTARWLGEGAQHTNSKPKLKEASWRLHKLGAFVQVTDELLEDAPALESHIKKKAPNAMYNVINDAIINGDGVAKPRGILNSSFLVSVAKEAAQAADTIVYKNLIKMEAKHMMSQNSVWLAHPQCKEQLRQLKDDNGNAIYMNGGSFPTLAAAGYDMLLGKPVIYMMGSMQALGDKGDIILGDLGYYSTVAKTSGIKQSLSTHLLFDYDITSIKFVTRIDGSCPYSNPVTTQYGSYQMSGFVALNERA